MGFDIYIVDLALGGLGNRDMYKPYDEYDMDTEEIPYGSLVHPDAPEFPGDDMTGKSNSRHPSYSGWSDFCEKTDLTDLFFNKTDGLMKDHPGFAEFDQSHYAIVHDSLKYYQRIHADKVPGFGFQNNEDYNLARLMWLEWWMKYAIDNFIRPGIYNH